MPRTPIVAIADDLTGAAEIAGIGHRHGLTASVISDFRRPSHRADVLVFNTDSRLDPPEIAAEKIRALGNIVAEIPCGLLYKKTDSVLRGPVRAELEALARSQGRSRILLVPANPALGRTVQQGQYSINGVPLHDTSFARDPHHPARTSAVIDLLGKAGSFPVNTATSATPPAGSGIILGDAASTTEVNAWANCAATSPHLLPAGAGEFFSALLRESGFREQPRAPLNTAEEPILVISGTTSPAGTALRQDAHRAGIPILPLPAEALRESAAASGAIRAWTHAVQTQVATAGHAIVVFDGPVIANEVTASAIRRAFGALAQRLNAHQIVAHLVVEGGATAAAISRTLGWHELPVAHEWAPGVVSLRTGSAVSLTLKPGSYAWPAALWQAVLSSGRKTFHA